MAEHGPGRRLRHLLEAAALHAALALFRLLPVEAASNLGGWLGRALGPRLPVSRRARHNLALALPALGEAQAQAVVAGMWDNLGRCLGEYPHLAEIADPAAGRVEVRDLGGEVPLAEKLRPGIMVAGHLANWEILGVAAGYHGLELTVVERAPNNPLLRGPLERLRGAAGGRRIQKGAQGARAAIATLEAGGTLGLLADQKTNDGIEVDFFGHGAMTTPGPAQLALRFGCPLVPVRVERTGTARFRLTCHTPLGLPAGGDRHADIAALTLAFNRLLEGWIRERPQDWLWLHRRWPEAAYRELEEEGGSPSRVSG